MQIFTPQVVAGNRITVTNTSTSLYSLINTAASGSDAVTAGFPPGLDGLNITPEDGDIRVLVGQDPTATIGFLLKQDQTYFLRKLDLPNLKLIAVSGNVICSYMVGKSEIGESSSASGSGSGSSSASSIGGGNSIYSNVQGDFTATANSGAKTITFSAYANTVLSSALTTKNFANAIIKRITSAGAVDVLPVTNISFAVNVLTLSDMVANFAVGDTVAVFVPGPDKGFDETNDLQKHAIYASNIPTATTMQNAAVANGNGTSLNVQGYSIAVLNIVSSVAMSGGTTINFEASVDDTTWVSIVAHQVGAIGTQATSTTADGDYRIPVAGYKSVRARISGYSAGTVTVKGYVTPIPGQATAIGISGGNIPHGSADSGNPVKTGGKYNSSAPTLSDGQRGDTQLDSKGNTQVNLNTLISGENQGKNRIMTTRPGTWVRMTTATTTTHVSGTCILSAIIVEVTLTGTVTVYDGLSASGNNPIILPIGTVPGVYSCPDGAALTTGLTVVTSAADRIVVGYALN